MTWNQIRRNYPNQWVLMEALQAHNEGTHRVFDQLGVLDACVDNKDVFPRYKQLKAQFPEKEIIFFHASREQMDIQVQYWLGARLPQ